jgi:hypothetical protein
MVRAVRPLSSYAQRVVKKIYKISPYDKAVAYSTRRSSPTRLTILENGSKEIFAMKVERDSGHYRIDKQWLVLETSPRAQESWRRFVAGCETERKDRLAAEADSAAKPAYKTFIRALTRELGKPRRAAACNRKHLAFEAPSDGRCAELIAEARTSGAAATLYYARWGRELRVVAGPPVALFALFDWQAWSPGTGVTLEQAVAALDKAAGLTLDYVEFSAEAFSLSLDRPLRKIPFEAVLADRLQCKVERLREGLSARRLVYGKRPVSWKKRTSKIVDPGTEDC